MRGARIRATFCFFEQPLLQFENAAHKVTVDCRLIGLVSEMLVNETPRIRILPAFMALAALSCIGNLVYATTITGSLSVVDDSDFDLQFLVAGEPTIVGAEFGGAFSVVIVTSTDPLNGVVPVALSINETLVTLDASDPFSLDLAFFGTLDGQLFDLSMSGSSSSTAGDTTTGTAAGTNTFDLSSNSSMLLDQASMNVTGLTGFLADLIPNEVPFTVDIENRPAEVLPGTVVTLTPTGNPGEFDVDL